MRDRLGEAILLVVILMLTFTGLSLYIDCVEEERRKANMEELYNERG